MNLFLADISSRDNGLILATSLVLGVVGFIVLLKIALTMLTDGDL